MRVIEGENVDLLSPFPASEVERVVGWSHCYKTYISVDGGPSTDEEFLEAYKQRLSQAISFAIVDKNGITHLPHEAPLVGLVTFDLTTPFNGYFHTVTSRRAWGRPGQPRLVDEAGKLALRTVFEDYPTLLRVSALIPERNRPAISLAHRMGLVREGVFRNFVSSEGEPRNMVHFGVLREEVFNA